MYRLACTTRLTVAIATLDREGVLFVERVDYPEGAEIASNLAETDLAQSGRGRTDISWTGYLLTIGSVMPFLTTASGRVLLASLTKSQVLDLVKRDLCSSSTAHQAEFWRELSNIRHQG
jgi:DNA-binding IclR family transcriptional regulator